MLFLCFHEVERLPFDVCADESTIERENNWCNRFALLNVNRPGPTVHSRSWCPLGSRWHRCRHQQPLWHLTAWRAHKDWVTGGKQFVCLFHGLTAQRPYDILSFFEMFQHVVLSVCVLLPLVAMHTLGERLCCSNKACLLPWILMIDESCMSLGTSDWDHFCQ